MLKLLISLFILITLSFAQDQNIIKTDKQIREEKQLQKNIEAEKKIAKEQKFYQGSEYNLKNNEVDLKSLKDIQTVPVDDLDMDDVYN